MSTPSEELELDALRGATRFVCAKGHPVYDYEGGWMHAVEMRSPFDCYYSAYTLSLLGLTADDLDGIGSVLAFEEYEES